MIGPAMSQWFTKATYVGIVMLYYIISVITGTPVLYIALSLVVIAQLCC